jgi:hypothetical protein
MNVTKTARIVSLIGALVAFPVAASGDGRKGVLIFSCVTSNQRFVEVRDNGATINYYFGKKGKKPELALSVPRSVASTHQYQGFGRYVSYAVTIPNKGTTYSVFYGYDKLSPDSQADAGIVVTTVDGKEATIPCASTFERNIEGIDLKADK